MDLFDELRAVATALDQAGVRYALIGGLAYSIWVEARGTEDIDLLIAPDDWPGVIEVLQPLGYRPLAGPMDFPRARIRRLTKIQDAEALVLDFVLADDAALMAGLDRAVTLTRGMALYRLAPPDVIIDLKKRRMSPKDQSDIEGLEKLLRNNQ